MLKNLMLIFLGVLFSTPLVIANEASETTNATAKEKTNINVKYKGIDILDYIHNVLGKYADKSIIIDPRVKGILTIIRPKRKLEKEEEISSLFAVLNVHGYSIVENKHTIKILPMSVAKHSEVAKVINDDDSFFYEDEYVTKVIRIKHVSVSELVALLKAAFSSGIYTFNKESNSLVLVSTYKNIQNIEKIITLIDIQSQPNKIK
jgi:type II secretory pathway component GspD/PulD (secretin)